MHAGHAHVHLGASLTCRVLLPAHDLHAQCDVASGRVGELGQWASGGRRAARLDASGALGVYGRHSAQRRLAAAQVQVTVHGAVDCDRTFYNSASRQIVRGLGLIRHRI